jgi:hypothetical protein
VRRSATIATGAAALALAAWLGTSTAGAKGSWAPVAVGARGVWVARDDGLVRVDPRAGRIAGSVRLRGFPLALAADRASVWTLGGQRGALVRIGEESGRVEAYTPLGIAPAGLAVGGRSIWVAGNRGPGLREAVLLRVDVQTLRIGGRFHLGRRPAPRLAAGHGSVWLAFFPPGPSGRTGLVAIDEATGRLRFRRRLAGYPAGLASGRDRVWIASERGEGRSRLLAIAGRSGTLTRSVDGPFMPGELSAGSDLVWAVSRCGAPLCDASRPTVSAYEEASGRPVAGPFRAACGAAGPARFPSGIAAMADAASVAVADGRGGLSLTVVSAGRGVLRCVRVDAPSAG